MADHKYRDSFCGSQPGNTNGTGDPIHDFKDPIGILANK